MTTFYTIVIPYSAQVSAHNSRHRECRVWDRHCSGGTPHHIHHVFGR
jgi:hypothetical protein